MGCCGQRRPKQVDTEAIKQQVREAVINRKTNSAAKGIWSGKISNNKIVRIRTDQRV